MRFRRRLFVWSSLVASLALIVPVLGAAGTTAAASPPNGGPPGLQINVSNNLNFRYGEPEVAVNPTNPNNIVYVANQLAFTYACQSPTPTANCTLVQSAVCALIGGGQPCQPSGLLNNVPGFDTLGIFASFDGGRTFQKVPDSLVPNAPSGFGPLNQTGDVGIATGPDGTFYLTYDDERFQFGTSGNPASVVQAGGIGLSTSTDGGLTWGPPKFLGTPVDRPFSAVDQSTGIFYEASGEGPLGSSSTGNPSSPVLTGPDRWLVACTNRGQHCSQPFGFGFGGLVGLLPVGPVSGPFITASQGEFAAAGKVCDPRAPGIGPFCGNVAVGAPQTAAHACAPQPAPCVEFQYTSYDPNAGTFAPWTRHPLPPSANTGGEPLVAGDPTTKGHFTVAVPDAANTQFTVYQTFDNGNTWTQNIFPAGPTSGGIWHPWMSYSPTGVLGIMWQVNPPGTRLPYTVWAAASNDGGATFSNPHEVAQSPSPQLTAIPFIGNLSDDFSYIALDRNKAFIAYADWQPGDRQGFLTPINIRALEDTNS
jgi:hypothetical protein